MRQPPDDDLLAKIEAHAVDIAREAGAILNTYFGKSLDVQFKDKSERDPVTNADKESQEFLVQAISSRFPDHSILGEEDDTESDSPARDFLWVLDPLDGTKNFMAGLPIYASSIGVLHQGVPIVGAVYIPWPSDNSGVVLHARSGAGALMEQEPISVSQADEPQANALIAMPGPFGAGHRFHRRVRGKIGEFRVTGSIAYELAMVAKGVFQYSITTAPNLWDVAGGAMLVIEAGGIMTRRRQDRIFGGLITTTRWEAADSLVPSWQSGVTTMKQLRHWSAPLLMGSPGVVRYVTSHMRARRLLRLRLPGTGWPPEACGQRGEEGSINTNSTQRQDYSYHRL